MKALETAAETVRAGGVVLVATETFYSMAADPCQEGAVRRIFETKRRVLAKPLPLIAADRECVERVAAPFSVEACALMDKFWPGSLTILFNASLHLSGLLTGSTGKIAIRVPPPCAAQLLAGQVAGLLTATSANLSGEPSPDTLDKISEFVRSSVDIAVDSGKAPGKGPSTIVEPVQGGFRVLRQGVLATAVICDRTGLRCFDESP